MAPLSWAGQDRAETWGAVAATPDPKEKLEGPPSQRQHVLTARDWKCPHTLSEEKGLKHVQNVNIRDLSEQGALSSLYAGWVCCFLSPASRPARTEQTHRASTSVDGHAQGLPMRTGGERSVWSEGEHAPKPASRLGNPDPSLELEAPGTAV